MNPIPPKLKKELQANPYYSRCVICYSKIVDWHHVFIYAGKQINEAWVIEPLCQSHHRMAHIISERVEQSQKRCLLRATDEDLKQYPKYNWKQLKERIGLK